MVVLNPQNPFAFKQKRRTFGNDRHLLGPRVLSSNIKGACVNCARLYQKVKKHDVQGNTIIPTCSRCLFNFGVRTEIVEFPKPLLPWKILDRRSSSFASSFYLPFVCMKCQRRFCSWAMFGAQCNHKAHVPTVGGKRHNTELVCRLCCTKVASKQEVEELRPVEEELTTNIEFTTIPPTITTTRFFINNNETMLGEPLRTFDPAGFQQQQNHWRGNEDRWLAEPFEDFEDRDE